MSGAFQCPILYSPAHLFIWKIKKSHLQDHCLGGEIRFRGATPVVSTCRHIELIKYGRISCLYSSSVTGAPVTPSPFNRFRCAAQSFASIIRSCSFSAAGTLWKEWNDLLFSSRHFVFYILAFYPIACKCFFNAFTRLKSLPAIQQIYPHTLLSGACRPMNKGNSRFLPG